jgi:hypothetical protein
LPRGRPFNLVRHYKLFATVFYRIALVIICFSFLFAAKVRSQQINPDTNTQLQADSVRTLDSGYRARKAQFDRWVAEERATARFPQEDFLSIYAGYGGYLQILARDLNQFFSERALRPDPLSDRNVYGGVDREIILAGQAQLAKTWGIYVEYDFTAKFSNTIVDSATPGPQNLAGAEEELDLYEHSLVVGGMVIIYTGPFYRLRADGGFGAVYALTSETESPSGAARSASAIGNQVNFDLLNDFRFAPGASFTLDFLFRTITTGELKTSSGETIDAPFGTHATPLTIKPTASNVVYGAAAGIVYYF